METAPTHAFAKNDATHTETEDHNAVTDPAVAPTSDKTGLTEGSHCKDCAAVIVAQKIVAVIGSGESESEDKNEDKESSIPATGDESIPVRWMCIMMLASMAIFASVAIIFKRKRENS